MLVMSEAHSWSGGSRLCCLSGSSGLFGPDEQGKEPNETKSGVVRASNALIPIVRFPRTRKTRRRPLFF